jgi:hypothetical protein
MKIDPFYAAHGEPSVQHDDSDCPYGREIPIGDRMLGFDAARRHCPWCATHREVAALSREMRLVG